MIDKLTSIPLGWKLAALALLMAAVSAVTFHYTSQHYAVKIGELNATVKNKDDAIKTAKTSIGTLVKALDEQNKAFEEFAKARDAEKRDAEIKVAGLEKEGRARAAEIAELRRKVPRPSVDLTVLTPAQIAAELGECRRAVNINNIADTGVLL